MLGLGSLDKNDYFFRSLALTWKACEMCTNNEKKESIDIHLNLSKLAKTVEKWKNWNHQKAF